MTTRRCDANDAAVGANIRVQRLAKRMSQAALAIRIGVTYQQLRKYEVGTNRIGAGRLVRIAAALDVPVMTLLDGVAPRRTAADGPLPSRLLAKRAPLRLVQAFAAIEDRGVQYALLAVAEGVVARMATRARSPHERKRHAG
jgi:transcriptional regulator with XRE-family HTH domain